MSQIVKLHGAGAFEHEIGLIRHRVHVRAAAEQTIGRGPLRVDVNFGQADPADQSDRVELAPSEVESLTRSAPRDEPCASA